MKVRYHLTRSGKAESIFIDKFKVTADRSDPNAVVKSCDYARFLKIQKAAVSMNTEPMGSRQTISVKSLCLELTLTISQLR